MATFLTTAKMNPKLADRVERSVTGRKGNALAVRRIVSIARLALVLTVVFGIYSVVRGRQQDRAELERTRNTLLNTVHAQDESLTVEDKAAVTRAESWLVPFSSSASSGAAYEGDLVADELRAPGALAAMLNARSSMYVRGPSDGFKTPARMAEASASSTKDSLLLCLLEPPASRTEKALLDKVRVAYLSGAPMEQRTTNVHRLNDAIVGLPILRPEWSDRVRRAPDGPELARLRTELDRTPIERTRQAVRAELFLMVLDEPSDGKGPTELDGERPHAIRLSLVDLAASRILLRVRASVDPSWISASKRPTYASGLDACAFAFDVHARAASVAGK